jgi:hypothetical protein
LIKADESTCHDEWGLASKRAERVQRGSGNQAIAITDSAAQPKSGGETSAPPSNDSYMEIRRVHRLQCETKSYFRSWSLAGAQFHEIIATLPTFQGMLERPVWGEQF